MTSQNRLVLLSAFYWLVLLPGLWAQPCPNPINANAGPDVALTCSVTAVTLAGESTTPNTTFTWNGPNGFTSVQRQPVISVPGTYRLIVTDAIGCTATDEVVVFFDTQPPAVDFSTTASKCAGSNSGAVRANVINRTADTRFQWSNGRTTDNIDNLAAGLYTVTVTNRNGCSTVKQVVIQEPSPIVVNFTRIDPACTSSGSLGVIVTGGVPPYSYRWSNGANTGTINNLSSGTYTLTITDQNGCTYVASSTLVSPLRINVISTRPSCAGRAEGSLSISINGAQPSFRYRLSDSSRAFLRVDSSKTTDFTIQNLPPGSYTLSVSNNTGCTSRQEVFVPFFPDANITVGAAGCGLSNGFIRVAIDSTGGPFGFDWADLPDPNNPKDRFNLPSGLYTLVINSLSGCWRSFPVIVPATTNLISVITTIPNGCGGTPTGSAVATVTNGTPPYRFAWSNGANTAAISQLSAGIYRLTITDAAGCTAVDSAYVTEKASPLSVVKTPCGFTVTGGSGAYSYTWPGGNPNSIPGTYTVTVTDLISGCTATVAEITSRLSIVKTPCGFTVTGGSAPYTYSWPGGNPNPNPGTYTVTVTDANGCTAATSVTVQLNPPICFSIEGAIRSDIDRNCQPQPTEPGVGGYLIRAIIAGGRDTFYATSGPNGRYKILILPAAVYTLKVISPSGSDQAICNNGITVTVPPNTGVQDVNFSVRTLPECPALTVDLSTPYLRRCSADNAYFLNVCNRGGVAAPQAYVDLTLDPLISLGISSTPVLPLGKNVYRLQLGIVRPGECRTLRIPVQVSCDAVLGQAHCSKAYVYPDSVCTPIDPQWSGAKIEATGRCSNGQVQLVLKNTGRAKAAQASDYIVIEDGIMARRGRTNGPLAAGDSVVITAPANGSTWRIESEQEPFAPFISQPTASIEGCTTTGSFSTGFITPFSTQERGPWEDVDCTANKGPFDPNDKQGFPTGFGDNRYIRPDTDLEYMIRFQNTGTDTAFTVIIRDTLSAVLDPLSVQPGASSHTYTFTLLQGNVLEFKFANIMLPDSNTNLAGSNGFVNFRVAQHKKATLESPIFNRAAIYFDGNAPILTNTTEHRIGEMFLKVSTWEAPQTAAKISIAPHPVSTSAVVSVDAAPSTGDYALQIFDLTGRLVKTCQSQTPQFVVERDALPAGLYVFHIIRDGAPVGAGKMLVIGY